MFDDEEGQQQEQFGQDSDVTGGFVAGMFKAFFMIMLVLFLAIALAGFVGYKAAYAADYYTQCSQWRITCGFSAPGTDWRRLFANGHDPAVSGPAGWTRMQQGPAYWATMGQPPEVWNGITVTRYYCDNPSLPYPPAGLGG